MAYLYFKKDQESGDTKGQDIESFGGEWYLVTPSGSKREEKQEETGPSGGYGY
ncbi:MAG: hypothetical protein ABEK59_06905 [Halobacteria archaeon]